MCTLNVTKKDVSSNAEERISISSGKVQEDVYDD